MENNLQLSKLEIQMMVEVFQIFSKYSDKTRSFGVHLLHSHFPLRENETLYETHNRMNRTLKIRPIRIKNLKKIPLATGWHQTGKNGMQVSMFCCDSE